MTPEEATLVRQLLSTTGPLGTLIVLGFLWLRGQFQRVHAMQRRHGKRIYRIERQLGIPVAIEDEPDTDVIEVMP